MITRYHITLGATTTAGGKVITSGCAFFTINGAPIALERDKCWCPKCNSEGVIMLDGPRLNERGNGLQKALSGDLCVCKCAPPPRLVAAQTQSYQTIDGDWHAAKAGEVAETAAKLNTAGSNPVTVAAGWRLVLVDDKTQEPYRRRQDRLKLTDTVIEGTTDQNGATRPLTADEHARIVEWHIVGENAPA
jgi:uncharacterized Zn-binding protein involved in type VI secretion